MKSKTTTVTSKRKNNTNVLSHKKVTNITLKKSTSKKTLPEKTKVITKKTLITNKKEKDESLSDYKDNTKELSHENNTTVTPQTSLVALNKPIIQTKLLNLAHMSDDIEEMLKHYKAKIKNVVEVPKIEINKKKVAGNVITRSFRIYEGVLKDFLKFAEKHDQFTIQDLLSQAVIEFIEHYHN